MEGAHLDEELLPLMIEFSKAMASDLFEANMSEIASDASSRYGKSVAIQPPGLVVMAPADYWAGYQANAKVGQWLHVLSSLAKEIDDLLSIDTHFLALKNATFRMGSRNLAPHLTGDYSVVGVAELYGG